MKKKYLVVGLGNPDKKFEYTRHNIGNLIIKQLILKTKTKLYLNNKFGSIYIIYNNYIKLILLLSNFYMNNIGLSVKYFLKKYKLKSKNLIVLSDDIYIKFGKIKLKKNSGSGGHNGLKSINNILKTKKYIKIKIGIGHDFKYGNQNKYVLNIMNKKELNYIYNNIYISIYNIILNLK
ncbi:MAG: aminoacyl-tRNA hydrolase [Candidatus Shikimatogenerans bostrichidophilus]|nr:MAG: aminoacyl-tRNA hydrolase [Candidatus Shikimatogenerans bostrichidophilus]